ncbi:MAG TPA: hypothetical protein VL357_05930 [Rariglobus sp.]|jgi:hypothetical protein|nr:hypothetical protein [Rariglobus sp.]
MGGPRHITPAMIATARERMAAGDSLKLAAAHLGVDQSALGYHLRGGKAKRHIGSPWKPHTKAGHLAIGSGKYAEAAYHFTAAAKVLINLK